MLKKLFGLGKSNGPQSPKAVAVPKGRRTNLEKRYTIVASTSQGSMSKVFRAVDNETGRTVCLKVQDAVKTALARSRSAVHQSEGEIAQQILHPHVVKTYDFGFSTKGDYFIVMEWIEGYSFNYLRESGGLDLPAKLELLAQSAEGLAAVHAAGFIHRDFGPKNLLVNRDDQVKLIDFGLAVPNIDLFKRPGNRTGTLNYMAPELVRREKTDERIDVFSFGVTAFEFLTNRMPYEVNHKEAAAVMRSRINSDPTKIETVARTLPTELCQVINKLLAKQPAQRWAKMSALPAVLREIAAPATATTSARR
jgi:serine/threonine protein kinase